MTFESHPRWQLLWVRAAQQWLQVVGCVQQHRQCFGVMTTIAVLPAMVEKTFRSRVGAWERRLAGPRRTLAAAQLWRRSSAVPFVRLRDRTCLVSTLVVTSLARSANVYAWLSVAWPVRGARSSRRSRFEAPLQLIAEKNGHVDMCTVCVNDV